MFIEDDELRELYKVASADHLEKLERGLLDLEQQPDDTSILDSLLRETHSLKGDSRMLGVEEAEMLVHQMEELLNEVKNNETVLSGDLCDRLYLGVDAVKKIATEAVTGEPHGVSTFHIMAQLMGAEEEETGGLEDEETGGLGDEEIVSSAMSDTTDEPSAVYIEDDELRELYKVASADHLEKLERGLLDLEQQPDDTSILDSLLRETHSLKGDSRMLGVEEAEMLVHQMEELLNEVKNNETVLSGDLCDRLYLGVDAVKKIATEAVTGEPHGVSTFHIMAQLMGAEDEGQEAWEQPFDFAQGKGSSPSASLRTGGAGEQGSKGAEEIISSSNPDPIPTNETQPKTPSTPSAQIETVRVDFPKLDALMTQAGELLVTKLRLERRHEDVGRLYQLWENWNRDYSLNQQLLTQLESKLTVEERSRLSEQQQHEQQYLEQFGNLVTTIRNLVREDNTRLDAVSSNLEAGIRNLRLLPLSTIFNLFPRMVRDLSKQLGKEIELNLEGEDIGVDKRILEEIKAPLTHIIRNAIDHGIETPQERIANNKPPKARLLLKASQNHSRITIEVIDDGRGLDIERIGTTALKRQVCSESELLTMSPQQIQSLIFAPGFSTRSEVNEISGRGVGLDVVRENVERLKGTVQVESTWGMGCKFQLSLNTSLSNIYVLIVEIEGRPYGIPIDYVEKMILVAPQEIFQVEGSPTILWEEKPLSVAWLKDLLDLKTTADLGHKKRIPCVILNIGTEKLGVLTNKLIEQQNVILKPQSKLLRKIPNISGSTILSSGKVCMIIEPRDLLQSTSKGSAKTLTTVLSKITTKPHILLVEDSIPIRTQVRRILISAGYDVTVAVDGLEGFNTLQTHKNFDAIVSDVEMPNLTGLDMTARIRQDREYDEIPIILVTTLATEADKRRGAEAGANAYLTKGDFDQTLLLNTLRRLI